MFFASDNGGPAHQAVLDALARANEGHTSAYGAEPAMDRVRDRLREVFEAPQAAVYLVATGTAANALALATMSNPWDTVFCTAMAHINEDECNAPEFYSGGAKLTLVGDRDARMDPQALHAAIAAEESRGVHGPQRGPVSITNATEKGTVYTPAEVAALSGVARDFGLQTHLDGARFANALVALDCTPAEMTWRAGVDAVSFGGTKNGLMGAEAVILFDPEKAWEFELRRKRGAHLFSKHRYLSAQMEAYLGDDLWLEMARRANATCAHLAEGLRQQGSVEFLHEPQANIIFARFPRRLHKRLLDAGAYYYVWDGDPHTGDPDALLTARLVCDWSIGIAGADAFLSAMRG